MKINIVPKRRAGGIARAKALTPEKKSEIGQLAASARWNKDIPKAEFEDTLNLGGIKFKCAVIEEDGKQPLRVISQGEFMESMGMYYSGYIAKQHREKEDSAVLPMFLAQSALKPFIDKTIDPLQFQPISYRTKAGSVAKGIPATIISKILKVWVDAKHAGVLKPRQFLIAQKAEIIREALIDISIVALIDEVTGYQNVRSRDALQLILESFLRKEFAVWAKRFPDEFYKEIYRLWGWAWSDTAKNKIQYVGKLTKDIVYQRLAPGIAEELEKRNPKNKGGSRSAKHHMWLTEDIGHPALAQHLHAVIGLMRACDSWNQFYDLINRAFPKRDQTVRFELDENSSKKTTPKEELAVTMDDPMFQ